MCWELTEEQKLIKSTAREFAEIELSPLSARIDQEKSIPESIIKKIGELGFWGVLVPEKFGGAGLDHLSLVLILEEISRACASTSVTMSVHNSLVCCAINKNGSSEQKHAYLPKLASGQIIGAYALTEPNAGSDAAAIETRAVKDGNDYILNGTKIFVTNGPAAGLMVIFARTHPDKNLRGKGISAFLVTPDMPGLKRGSPEEKMGVRGANVCEVVFEDCRVPAVQMLGEEHQGFKVALDSLNSGRIGIAIQSVGIAQAALDASLKYVRERKQFGRFLSEFQAIQGKLAEMATGIKAARLLAYQAAVLRDQGLPHHKESSMAKLFASTICNRVAKESVQIHGGVGYTKEFPVERYFRDAKVTEIYEGTSEVQRIIISRAILED